MFIDSAMINHCPPSQRKTQSMLWMVPFKGKSVHIKIHMRGPTPDWNYLTFTDYIGPHLFSLYFVTKGVLALL